MSIVAPVNLINLDLVLLLLPLEPADYGLVADVRVLIAHDNLLGEIESSLKLNILLHVFDCPAFLNVHCNLLIVLEEDGDGEAEVVLRLCHDT